MRSLLLVSLLLGCAWSVRLRPDRSSRRGRREAVTVEDAVKASVEEYEARAQAIADAAVAKLEARLGNLEKTLSEHSGLLGEVLEALAAFSDHQRGVTQTVSALSHRLDGVTTGPRLSDRPSLITARVLGEPCRRDSDCGDLLAGTVCSRRGRCGCRQGLQRVAGEMCRPSPRLSEECRSDKQCNGGTPHAVCPDGVCSCPPAFLTFDMECRPFPRLTERCRTDGDCRGATAHSVCADGVCACPPGFWNLRNVQCRRGVGVGKPCLHDLDCSTILDITACIAGVCAVRSCETDTEVSDRFRLIGGSACDNGYVQFTYNAGELWKFVCDTDWTERDATVMCRYMGFDYGSPKPVNPDDSRNITHHWWVDDVLCQGTEPSLSLCPWNYGRDSCMASEVAAVDCHVYPTEQPSLDDAADSADEPSAL